MDDMFERIKKFKAFEKILFVISNNKFIIKDLEKQDEHHAMQFTNKKILDVHRKDEGSDDEGKYESLGRFDVTKTVQEIISEPQIMVNAFEEIAKGMKEVNFDEDEFSHLKVGIMPSKEEFSKLATKKKDKMEIPQESAKEFDFTRNLVPWNKAKNIVDNTAMVLDKEVIVGMTVTMQGKNFYMDLELISNSSISKFIDIMTNPKKNVS